MGVYFWYRHARDIVVILEEGNLPHQRCPLCGILVTWKALDGKHRLTAQCTWGAERKRRQLSAEEGREVTDRAFSTYGHPLYMVTSFKYLVQVILVMDNDWTAVVKNLDWVKKVWSRMSRILSREGATPWLSSFFFEAVIQEVLFFGAYNLVVTPHMVKALVGVHTQVVIRMTVQITRRTTDGIWRYTSSAAAS